MGLGTLGTRVGGGEFGLDGELAQSVFLGEMAPGGMVDEERPALVRREAGAVMGGLDSAGWGRSS